MAHKKSGSNPMRQAVGAVEHAYGRTTGHMKAHHAKAMHSSMESAKRAHHSDPIVGGVSEDEGRVVGQGEYANLPQDVKMTLYPSPFEAGPMVLDDTQGHVNDTQKQGHMRVRGYMSNQH